MPGIYNWTYPIIRAGAGKPSREIARDIIEAADGRPLPASLRTTYISSIRRQMASRGMLAGEERCQPVTEREQTVLDLRDCGETLRTVAEILGVSRERVRQLEQRARLKQARLRDAD